MATVFIPKLNEKDYPDLAAEVREQLEIVWVETVDEVLHYTLERQHCNGRQIQFVFEASQAA